MPESEVSAHEPVLAVAPAIKSTLLAVSNTRRRATCNDAWNVCESSTSIAQPALHPRACPGLRPVVLHSAALHLRRPCFEQVCSACATTWRFNSRHVQ